LPTRIDAVAHRHWHEDGFNDQEIELHHARETDAFARGSPYLVAGKFFDERVNN
jgi:hypothetical protein